MRIAHVSDFHFTCLTWNPLRLFSKRILGNLNWLFIRKDAFSIEPLQALPELFQELFVDRPVFRGDFTTTSLLQEFEFAAKFRKQFSQKWIAIPGNHDKYTYRSDRKKYFYRYFTSEKGEITHPIDFFSLKNQGVEAYQIEEHLWVVALDTARATHPYSSEGLFSEKLEEYLKEVIGLIPKEDRIILLNHYPFFQNDDPRRCLKRGEALQKLIQDHPQIRLYLHGHTHRNTVADLRPNQLPIILDSGSSGQKKQASWNLIEILEDRCSVDVYQWTDGWKKERTEAMRWK